MAVRQGRYTLNLPSRPSIIGNAAVVGKTEGEGPLKAEFDHIYTDDTLGEIYREIRKLPSAENSVALAEMLPAYPAEEVIFAAEVFAELGLLRFESGGIAFPKGKRSELGLSALYRAVCALKER